LRHHEVLGLTRSSEKLGLLSTLGARGAVCDIYQPGAFAHLAATFAPEVVVNFLTDLAAGPGPANTRIRQEGGPVVVAAAKACGARRLVVESISFAVPGASGEAVKALEEGARASGLQAWILRFARLWGPDTWDATPPEPSAIEISEAGRLAAAVILNDSPGTYLIDSAGASQIAESALRA